MSNDKDLWLIGREKYIFLGIYFFRHAILLYLCVFETKLGQFEMKLGLLETKFGLIYK